MTDESPRPPQTRTVSEIRAGIGCCFSELSTAHIVPVSSRLRGWDADVYWVNGRSIIQTPKPGESAARFLMLRRLHPLLAERLNIPVPQFTRFVRRCPRLGTPLVVYPAIPGRPLNNRPLRGLPARKRARFAERLGRTFSELHRIPTGVARRAGVPPLTAKGIRHLIGSLRRVVFPHLTQVERSWADELFEKDLQMHRESRVRDALIHADICSDHILWDGREITGIIYWADAQITDPAGDFGGLVLSYGKRFARQVLASYHDDDPGLIDRPAQVYLPIAVLRWMRHRITCGNPALFRDAGRLFSRARSGRWPPE